MSDLALAAVSNPIYLPRIEEAPRSMESDSDEDVWLQPNDASSVVVEYEFFNVPESSLNTLPRRVTEAVATLVRRRRVPSDDDVRDMVQPHAASTDSSADNEIAESARVRVVLAQNVALDLAMHRSFQEGGNKQQTRALTQDEIFAMQLRSEQMLRRRARTAHANSEDNTCVICMEKVFEDENCIVVLSSCGHAFHKDCIVQWLERLPRACPLCKSDVDLTLPPPPGVTTRSRARAMRRAAQLYDETTHTNHTSEPENEVCL